MIGPIRNAAIAATLSALGVCLVAPAHAGEETRARTAGAAQVLSGGVGENARQQLAEQARGYELKLVFAADSGAYLAKVPVTITDQAGRTVVNHVSEGPWMFVDLPSGTYTVKAEAAGKVETKKVSVTQGRQKTADFRWPASLEGVVVHSSK